MNYNLFLWEDWKAENFYPLALTRPVYALRTGAKTFIERSLGLFPESFITLLCREQIAELTQFKTRARVNQLTVDPNLPVLLINGRALINEDFKDIVESTKETTLFVHENAPVALLVRDTKDSSQWTQFFTPTLNAEAEEELLKSFPVIEVPTKVVEGIWELMVLNGELIESDFEKLEKKKTQASVDERAILYNSDKIWIGDNASIDALAVLDARGGPIIIENGVYIQSHTIITGPAYIGAHTKIYGGKIRNGCSFGPHCRLGGEIESSIFLGYSNKYHDGFIGHSYIGEWVNLGALTTTSDLKNNYGPIRLTLNGVDLIQTDLVKLGSFIGDHAKLGIGTLLNAGTVIGVAANFFGGGLAPKFVPSFVWGSTTKMVEHELERALETARMVYSRRGLELPFAEEILLRKIFDSTAELRSSFLSPNPQEEETPET